MASVYDISGTSHHSFKIGDGPTFYYGNVEPMVSIGNVGDVYILTATETNNSVISVGSMYIKSNINNRISWIKLGSGNGGQVDLSNYVSVIKQTFTEQQKKQARDNIDAISKNKIVYSSDKDVTVIISDNTYYTCDELSSLHVDLSNNFDICLDSKICFTSGQYQTIFSLSGSDTFIRGDDVVDGIFTPTQLKRYTLSFEFDNKFKIISVSSVPLIDYYNDLWEFIYKTNVLAFDGYVYDGSSEESVYKRLIVDTSNPNSLYKQIGTFDSENGFPVIISNNMDISNPIYEPSSNIITDNNGTLYENMGSYPTKWGCTNIITCDESSDVFLVISKYVDRKNNSPIYKLENGVFKLFTKMLNDDDMVSSGIKLLPNHSGYNYTLSFQNIDGYTTDLNVWYSESFVLHKRV